jgi:hypothetical protein
MNRTTTFKIPLPLLFVFGVLSGCQVGELSVGVETNAFAESTSPAVITPFQPESETQPPEATNSPTIPSTFTPTAPATPTPLTESVTACVNVAEFVQDLSVQDKQEFHPGTQFLKSWRLRNAGTCTWTQNYAYLHTGGNLLADHPGQPLPTTVQPGEMLDLTVAMTAPDLPGLYLSEWMLQDSAGELFGVGQDGNAPFWARINVVPASSDSKATPYADSPAAGICAEFEGEVISMTINPGIPDPRCVIVNPNQRLRVVNKLESEITASLGSLTATIAPGSEYTFEKAFGELLMPGVHNLGVTPCCGGSLWLMSP